MPNWNLGNGFQKPSEKRGINVYNLVPQPLTGRYGGIDQGPEDVRCQADFSTARGGAPVKLGQRPSSADTVGRRYLNRAQVVTVEFGKFPNARYREGATCQAERIEQRTDETQWHGVEVQQCLGSRPGMQMR